MPLHEDEAIVLRCYDLAEADRIVVLFTHISGKVRGVAAGAKRIKSGFMGSLDAATHIRVKYFENEAFDLVRIKETTVLSHFLKRPDFATSLHLLYMTEVLEQFTTDRNANQDLFRLALATFRAASTGVPIHMLARYFEYWILRLEGVWPNAQLCSDCGISLTGAHRYFSGQSGGFHCDQCTRPGDMRLERSEQEALRHFARQAPTDLEAANIAASSLAKLEWISQSAIRRHLERDVRSYRLLKELLPS